MKRIESVTICGNCRSVFEGIANEPDAVCPDCGSEFRHYCMGFVLADAMDARSDMETIREHGAWLQFGDEVADGEVPDYAICPNCADPRHVSRFPLGDGTPCEACLRASRGACGICGGLLLGQPTVMDAECGECCAAHYDDADGGA